MARLGQNFLADPNLLAAIVREAGPEPGDVVLEVGGGEGALTAELAPLVATLHVIELDRRLRPALERVAAEYPGVELHFADAMRFDLAALEPAPDRMVANLPYAIATPLILRTIACLPGLGSWTLLVQREIADRLRADAGLAHVRVPERARAALLRGSPAADDRPGGVQAPAAGRLGAAPPRADRAGRRSRESRAWSATPSRTGASRWRARSSTRGRAAGIGRARRSPTSAWRRTRGRNASRPAEFAALAEALDGR